MAEKEAKDTVEKVIDEVAETVETIERIPKVHLNGTTKKQQIIILAVTSLSSAAIAGFISYKVSVKRLEKMYEDRVAQEVAEARKFYAAMHKKEEYASPESTLEQYEEKVGESYKPATEGPKASEEELLSGETEMRISNEAGVNVIRGPELVAMSINEEVTPVKKNIFADAPKADEFFDLEVEIPRRDPLKGYVLHHDEFMQNEPEHEQATLTYYQGDDVLVDDRDQPVPDPEDTVGQENLKRFGHGSKDGNVVYIRNERIGMDFEIVRSEGDYVTEVLGLQHSETRRVAHDRRRNGRKTRGGARE